MTNKNHEKALSALLETSTIAEAAKKSKLSEATLYRYLSDEDFKKEYQAARRRIFEQNIFRLQSLQAGAVNTLERNLTCENPYEYLQLRNKLNESIRATGEKMVDALFRFVSKQVEMENSLAGIEPMVYLSELELPKRTTDIVSGPSPVRPSIEFAEAVSAVETFIKNRRQFEAKQQKAAAKAQADEAFWNRCRA